MLAATVLFICVSVCTTSAAIPGAGYTPDEKSIPDYPDSLSGKDYIVFYYKNFTELVLIIFDSEAYAAHGSSTSTYNNSGSNVIKFLVPGEYVTYITMWNGSSFDDWSYAELALETLTFTPPELYILRSTVDLYNINDKSILFFEKNAIKLPESSSVDSLIFEFIQNPESVSDRIYNLLLLNSISGFIIVGYFVLKSVFGRMRIFRNWKGDKK